MSTYKQSGSLARLHGNPAKKKRRKRTWSRKAYGAETRELRRTARDVVLTPEQRAVTEAVDAWLMSDERALSLSGYAGTGKSTTVKAIAQAARARLWTVRLAASTHKAAAAVRLATGLHAETAHRVLGVTLVDDKKTGETKVKVGQSTIDGRTLLVIDEAYMLSDHMVEVAMRAVKKHGAKVLFVGDPCQLAPVKAKASVVLDPERCEWPVLRLTEVHRQAADNPIVAAATAIRTAEPGHMPKLETSVDGNGAGIVVMNDKREWADLMIKHCARANEENRYLGWTNAAVDAAGRAIRVEEFGEEAMSEPYLPGERLVLNSRCVVEDRAVDKGRSTPTKIILENNDEIDVLQVKRDGPWCWLQVKAGDEVLVLLTMINYMERIQHLERHAAVARKDKKWADFFTLRDSIADVRPAKSITVHRAQGSTLSDVFFNADEIARCNDPAERQRLLYVAVTRASRTVYIYGDIR